jgi:uncharacterized cupin superfamily protein
VAPRAELVQTEHGVVPEGVGWYVVNARETAWLHTDELGSACTFEGDVRFPAYGINIHVLRPGEPNSMYHTESAQENFLVLAGECLLLVEGEELRLGPWDFVHCPPWTEHVFVGAGEGPCAILMVGERPRDWSARYPVREVALRHRAGVESQTADPDEAYARFPPPRTGPYREGSLPS